MEPTTARPVTDPQQDEHSPLVTLRALERTHRIGTSSIAALRGIDLDVRRGEILCILGVSGSGKSTLLHLLGALDSPSGGAITVAGRDLASMNRVERALFRRTVVGFVFQSYHLVPSLTAQGNVELALTLQGTYGDERRRRAREALRVVGLEERVDHRPSQLSGGEQQRVAVARAIVHRPPLILADEPTGNLDSHNAASILALLRDIRRDLESTVVMVTHDEESARSIADRVVRLRDGLVQSIEEVAR